MSHNDETWRNYTLSKEDPKIYKWRETPFDFNSYQQFFTGN